MTKETNRKVSFTQINNEMLNDPNLSLQDKGLLSVFLSNPEGVSLSEIMKRSKNGEYAHSNSIDNLIENGYFARVRLLNEGTKTHKKTIYIFSDSKEDVSKELEQYKNNKLAVINANRKKQKKGGC